MGESLVIATLDDIFYCNSLFVSEFKRIALGHGAIEKAQNRCQQNHPNLIELLFLRRVLIDFTLEGIRYILA